MNSENSKNCPVTESEYIRALSDAELAEYLFKVTHTSIKAINAGQILDRLRGPAGPENRIWR